MPHDDDSTVPRPERHTITDVRQLAELRSPVRQNILWALTRTGACSVAEISDLLEQPAASLYYHLHRLVRAGLLVESGERDTGRRSEKLYAAVADEVVVDPDDRSEAFVEELGRVATSAFRAAARGHRRALRAAAAESRARTDHAQIRQWSVRLSADSLERLQARLERLGELVRDHHDPSASAYTLTVAFSRRSRADDRS